MELLGKLGIDIRLLIAQTVNFGLLLWLLAKFVYKPILKQIEKDENELKNARIEAESLLREKNDFAREKEKEIANAKNKAREIIEKAENVAKEIKKRAYEEGEREKKAVVEQIHARLKEIEDR